MNDIAIAAASEKESPVAQGLAMIERASRDPSVDVAKMMGLQEMQFRMLDRFAEEEWNAAISSMPKLRVARNGTISLGEGKDGKSRAVPFAKWEDMAEIIEPLLKERQLFLTFDSVPKEGGGMIITGTLRHRSGHKESASIPLAIDTGPGRNNLQAMGSTLSYGKRYTAEMLLMIVRIGADDDGKAGGTKFITDEQEEELLGLCHQLGKSPDELVQQAFRGEIHEVHEIEQGQGHTMFKNLLLRMIAQRKAKP
jgi:hypothetical protein